MASTSTSLRNFYLHMAFDEYLPEDIGNVQKDAMNAMTTLIMSTDFKTSTARKVMSARLPIGVATMYNMLNPKSEYRNPKQIRIFKIPMF